jgi:solute carrier family 35 protein E3
MGDGEKFQLGTIGALSLSVVSSVSIVICNKALMSTLHFIFGKFKRVFYRARHHVI